MNTAFGFGKSVSASFDDAIAEVTARLEDEGFGVLSHIDIAAKMQEKLGETMPRYTILGACNPGLAFRAIQAVPQIGLLLPCNVLVSEDETGQVSVSFMDPASVLGLVDHPDVQPLASDVKDRLKRVLNALQ